MLPLKITIGGDYYDSQIYAGCLYLWTIDGSILTIDWNKLIQSIKVKEELKLAVSCAFLKSDYLYGTHWHEIYQDSEIKPLMISKFERLREYEYYFTKDEVEKIAIKSETDNPFIFPHADLDLYYNQLIVSSHEGIDFAATDAKLKKPIRTHSLFRKEIPALDISPSNLMLAVAGGNEGIFSIKLINVDAYSMRASFEKSNPVEKVTANFSSKVEWMFQTIAGMDESNVNTLAQYELPRKNVRLPVHEKVRQFSQSEAKIIDPGGILGTSTKRDSIDQKYKSDISWAERDKLCHLSDDSIKIFKYLSWKPLDQLEDLGSIKIPADYSDYYTVAKSANFGYILEGIRGILVIQSDGEWYKIRGTPTNWRTFNRSTNYSNHLHVILDDKIEIYSFNNDYFVDQTEKRVGLWHSPTLTEQKNARNEYLTF